MTRVNLSVLNTPSHHRSNSSPRDHQGTQVDRTAGRAFEVHGVDDPLASSSSDYYKERLKDDSQPYNDAGCEETLLVTYVAL